MRTSENTTTATLLNWSLKSLPESRKGSTSYTTHTCVEDAQVHRHLWYSTDEFRLLPNFDELVKRMADEKADTITCGITGVSWTSCTLIQQCSKVNVP